MSKPLTKSSFKLALECPTKLYYEARKGQYRNRMQGDSFLAALADGGHQLGALAKFFYHPDPIGQAITVQESRHDEAVLETLKRLARPGQQVIAEAALRHENYFVRVDILISDPVKKQIDIIEVKSKAVDDLDVAKGFKEATWKPYLYDVAFQAEVARLCFPGWKIVPKLALLNKAIRSDVDGLHQQFKVVVRPGEKSVHVEVVPGVNRMQLGSMELLREVDVTDIVDDLLRSPVKTANCPPEHSQDMRAFMAWASQLQRDEIAYRGGISKACKDCQYRADPADPLQSGVHECLQEAMAKGQIQGDPATVDRSKALSFEIWGGLSGARSMAAEVIRAGRAYLADIRPEDLPVSGETSHGGFSGTERRLAQIRAAQGVGGPFEIREARLAQLDHLPWPLHMIDFETAAPALPFFKGGRPYETLAFQFSHHLMEKDSQGRVSIRHASQWISTQPGVYPSFEFVRRLKAALMPGGTLEGTVFRYHSHENTVLSQLREPLAQSQEPDRDALVDFIDLVTTDGPRAMVDLHRLVQEGYYSAHAGGSISLKYMLPAVLNDAPGLKALYARPAVYGKGQPIESLNFDEPQGHIWLRDSCQFNPYLTLPPIFGPDFGDVDSLLARLCGEDGSDGTIGHGGAAMTAFNYTQYESLPQEQRARIEAALLRYCELDTLAMVMLVQGLMELRKRPFVLAGF